MNVMRQYLKNLISNVDSASMMRFLTLFTVVDILFTWNVVCFSHLMFVDIPWGVVAVLTAMVTGKAIQKFAESPKE